MDLRKQESETMLEYYKRILNGKLVDKTLADYDYSELAELIYGKTYSSDFARRMMYGSKKVIDLIDESVIDSVKERTGSDVLDSIAMKQQELQRERQRLSDQRREYNRILNSEGRFDNLCDKLSEAAMRLDETVGRFFTDGDNIVRYAGSNEAVLVFSDWHYGMVAQNVFNEYNTDICKKRIQYVVARAEDILRTHQCGKLHIIVLGDLIHGGIHTSARVASEELVCDQLMQVSEILAQSILELSHYVDGETVVYMTYGNHARTIQNKNDSIHRDNLERIIPWWLTLRFKECNNVTIAETADNEFLFVNACGHDICAAHGDLDSVHGSPRLLSTLMHRQYGKEIEYIILGDKHHRESFDELGVTASICGSLCGSDEYANNKRLYSSPEQMMLIVNPEYGVDAEYHIRCN